MSHEIDAYDYQRYAILFVADGANTRKYFTRLFGDKFRILEAADDDHALSIFRQHAAEIGIILTDQRMPREAGAGFLSKIAQDNPDIIRILSTAYSDIDAAIGSVNHGGIFRYVTKPWDIPQLEVTLRRAMEFFSIKRERDALLTAKMQALGNVLLSSRLAAFALAPVCAGIPVKRAAEAVGSFVKIAVGGRRPRFDEEPPLRSPDWARLHHRQVSLASALEVQLPLALTVAEAAPRAEALQAALHGAGALGITLTPSAGATRIYCHTDPTPRLLDAIFGRDDEGIVTQASIRVLAAFIAFYDAGGAIHRIRGEGLTLDLTASTATTAPSSPGTETAKWLLDDALLISAALGLW